METNGDERRGDDVVAPEELEALTGARAAARPDVSRLPDGVACGKPLFGPGDRIVIERRCSTLVGRPYLDTRTYRVVSLDPASGDVRLWDEEALHFAGTNVGRAVAAGHTIKMARAGMTSTSKRKRGRPRKERPVEEGVAAALPEAPKRGRGRPKGSKNRPRDVVAAERGAKRDARARRRWGR